MLKWLIKIRTYFRDWHVFFLLKKELEEVFLTLLKKYSKTNNKYIKCFDSSKERKFIMYLNANNWYG